uniref:Uncharacterized protein n=1 Tax=Salmo trutta TaxID=8032 RepID=A0A674AD21_SALTR
MWLGVLCFKAVLWMWLGVLCFKAVLWMWLDVLCFKAAWTVGGTKSTDLWYSCLTTNGGYHCSSASKEDWIQAVQALMVLSVLFCLFSLVFFMCQLFTLVKGGRFFFTAIFQILASDGLIYIVLRKRE